MPLPLLAAIGVASSVAGGLKGIFAGAKQNKEANKINPVWKDYTGSQAAKDMLGMASTRANSRNPYAEANRRAALGAQANSLSAIKRTSLDPSQALALASASQGQLDQTLFNQGQQDLAYEQQNIANLMNAQNTMVGEDRYMNEQMKEKYAMDLSQKNALKTAATQSIVGGLQNIGAGLISAGMASAATGKTGGTGGGMFSNLFGGGLKNQLLKNPELMKTLQMGAQAQAQQGLADWMQNRPTLNPLLIPSYRTNNSASTPSTTFGTNFNQFNPFNPNGYQQNPNGFGTNYNGLNG